MPRPYIITMKLLDKETIGACLSGIQRCSRYAFGPNRLHYCGPDAHRDLHAYIEAGITDAGLTELLAKFQTMYPYLRTIARANAVRDPFDARVVDAYWIGNALLDRVGVHEFHRLLVEEHGLKRKLGTTFSDIEEHLERGALPSHTFHVLNIWRRTGHHAAPHTIESMDACRVSWGLITKTDGPFLEINRRALIRTGDTLALDEPKSIRIARGLEAPLEIDEARVGDTISLHWGVPCEVLTPAQARNVERYTLQSIQLANG
ncbi:MAG: DUF6390 family protein [Candidatus Uhrbacteria bacterium]